jgi:hypothetical protein
MPYPPRIQRGVFCHISLFHIVAVMTRPSPKSGEQYEAGAYVDTVLLGALLSACTWRSLPCYKSRHRYYIHRLQDFNKHWHEEHVLGGTSHTAHFIVTLSSSVLTRTVCELMS